MRGWKCYCDWIIWYFSYLLSRERDGLQSELDTLRHAMVEMEGASKISREEREQARKEVWLIIFHLYLLHSCFVYYWTVLPSPPHAALISPASRGSSTPGQGIPCEASGRVGQESQYGRGAVWGPQSPAGRRETKQRENLRAISKIKVSTCTIICVHWTKYRSHNTGGGGVPPTTLVCAGFNRLIGRVWFDTGNSHQTWTDSTIT